MADLKKPTAKKAAPAKPAKASAVGKKATPAKSVAPKPVVKKVRTAARPVTRAVVKKTVAAAPLAAKVPRAPRAVPQPLPTAPAGQVPLIGANGSMTGSIVLPEPLTISTDATVVFQSILAAQANARQGTAATKNRARVAGGGAKPWRQKGTGRARAGSTRSPLWRHGGVAFGPNGRTYDQRIPARIRRAAFAASFAERAAEGRVLVLEELRLPGDRGRSADLVDWVAKVGEVRRAIIVTATQDENLARAAANVKALEIRTSGSLRLIDVLQADTLLVLRDALDPLAARAALEKGTAKRANKEAA